MPGNIICPAILRLKGDLNKDVLEKTLRAIIERHEVLRTLIREHEGQGYQQIMTAENWSLEIIATIYKEGSPELSKCISALATKPFDFSSDYMLRAELIGLGKDDHILVVTMHHVASDGWSRSILVKEVIEIYEAFIAGQEANLPNMPAYSTQIMRSGSGNICRVRFLKTSSVTGRKNSTM